MLVPPVVEVMACRGFRRLDARGTSPGPPAVLGVLNEVVFFDGHPSHHGVAMRATAGRADSLTPRDPAPGTGPTVDPGSEQQGGVA